jgi:hypothetical protein
MLLIPLAQVNNIFKTEGRAGDKFPHTCTHTHTHTHTQRRKNYSFTKEKKIIQLNADLWTKGAKRKDCQA